MDYPTCQYTGHIEPYRDCGDCPYLEDCDLQAAENERAMDMAEARAHARAQLVYESPEDY